MFIQADKQVRLAAGAVGVDSEGLPSAEVPAANWCINSSSSNSRTNSSSNSSSDSTKQPLKVSCQHQLANGLEPAELRRGVPPFWEVAPGILIGGPLPLQQLEAESSDRAAAVAVAAETAGERPAAAAAAAAAGSPHRGPAL
ncbi:hypothetical protein Efla_006829 [Eimeria flavescens]